MSGSGFGLRSDLGGEGDVVTATIGKGKCQSCSKNKKEKRKVDARREKRNVGRVARNVRKTLGWVGLGCK